MYRIAEVAGLSYPTLVEKVVADAIQRLNWFLPKFWLFHTRSLTENNIEYRSIVTLNFSALDIDS